MRRGAANLLGGRATRFELHGLTAAELGTEFDLTRLLNHGYLPPMYEAARPQRRLDAYIANYLREEVAAEGLVRNLSAFAGSERRGLDRRRDREFLERRRRLRSFQPLPKATSRSWRTLC